MDLHLHEEFYISLNDAQLCFRDIEEVALCFRQAIREREGKISLSAKDAQRPRWQEFAFGLSNYLRHYFVLQWRADTACLTFLDEHERQYHCLAETSQVGDSAYEKSTLFDPKYCLTKTNAIDAVEELIKRQEMPIWLEYELDG